MNKTKRNLFTAAAVTSMLVLSAQSAWATETRSKISSVTLTIDSEIEAGEEDGDVNVTTSSSNYTVTDIDITNDSGEWEDGDQPKVKITLEADDAYYFSFSSKSSVKLKGDDATCTGVTRKKNDDGDKYAVAVISVTLDKLEGTLELDDVGWKNEDSAVATWDEDGGAKYYQVRLYRDDKAVGSSVSTEYAHYNFASSITKTGEYTFKVRAVGSSGTKGEWYESDSLDVDSDNIDDIQSSSSSSSSSSTSGPGASSSTFTTASSPQASGQWIQDSVGWWYRRADGTYPYGQWMYINSKWYAFNDSGYMLTGWIMDGNGTWYYCGSDGAMVTSSWVGDYYVNSNGAWEPNRTK